MDVTGIIILAIIALILVVLAMIFTIKIAKSKKRKRAPDYYALFIMGLIWLVVGIPLDNTPL